MAGSKKLFIPTEKVKIGSLVDAFLTEPDLVDINDKNYLKAKKIASCIKNNFGHLIKRFENQVCYSAEIEYQGLILPTIGKLDWLLPEHAVIDLKFTKEKSLTGVINHFGYNNQLWHYSRLAVVRKAYIIAYSDAIVDCLPIINIDVREDENEFWKNAVLKYGH